MFEIEIDVDVAAVQGQRGRNCFLRYRLDLSAILSFYFLLGHGLFKRRGWWRLVLRRAPRRSDAAPRRTIRLIGPLKNCGAEDSPGESGAKENESDCGDAFYHGCTPRNGGVVGPLKLS